MRFLPGNQRQHSCHTQSKQANNDLAEIASKVAVMMLVSVWKLESASQRTQDPNKDCLKVIYKDGH